MFLWNWYNNNFGNFAQSHFNVSYVELFEFGVIWRTSLIQFWAGRWWGVSIQGDVVKNCVNTIIIKQLME